MKNFNPLVSIIIPVYNGSNYVREAINSALTQTYKNIEIIVVNDGSTDNGETEKIAKSYGNKIRYFSKKNGGVSTALNLGIKNMKGDFFSWLSHDDLYYPEKIEMQIKYLISQDLVSKKIILYSNYDVINEKTEKINTVHFEVYYPNEYPEYALLRGLISGTTILIPKSAFKEHGLFDENYRCIQDYLLFYNLMKTYKYIFIPEITGAIRVHQKQVTNNNPKIVSENNFLWTKMQKDLPIETKIKLEGSGYWFYIKMYQFLINHNNYTEAQSFSLQQANKFLEIECLKIDSLMKKLNPNDLFLLILNSFRSLNQKNDLLEKKFSRFFVTSLNDENELSINKIIHNIGFEKTIDYILNNKNYLKDKSVLKKYTEFNNYIDVKKNDKTLELKKLKKIMKFFKISEFIKKLKIF